ncbi:MAG TPA: glycosyltransferase family 4 protein [Cellvibrionaceae bacterium]
MKKIIIIAYDLNPNLGSEAGVSFVWSEVIAAQYNVVAYTQAAHQKDIEKFGTKLVVRYVQGVPFVSRFLVKAHLYNLNYALFIKSVGEVILNDVEPGNTIIHFLSPFGIHSYSSLAEIAKSPYFVGPVGGYLKMPKGFESYKKLPMLLKETFYFFLLKKRSWKNYFENAKAIICGTELVKSHMPELAKPKVSIIYDSLVDANFFRPDATPPTPKKNPDSIKIIFTGRLVLYKGVFLLMQAFESLSTRFNNIQLIYVGEGAERSALEAYAKQKGLSSRVIFTGRVGRDELKRLLLDSDIYCLPTLKDPGGNAIFEAMACGLPVVTSNYGGPAYSVSSQSGILIDPVSIPDYVIQLAAALERLIVDANLRMDMGLKAREHVVNNYSLSVLRDKILAFYEKNI